RYVVTASFVKEIGVTVTSPPIAVEAPKNLESITVIVEPAGIFNVNGRLLSKDSLAPCSGRLIGLSVVPITKTE
ncbi:MAG: hypothetical protein ACR2QS_08690, partial [Woeseiaceae bacterium]